MKTYVLTLSVTFPKWHPKAGEPTCFKEKMGNAIYHMRHPEVFEPGEPNNGDEKYHTIRANYELWKKRFEQIAAGEAVLSVRQWSGKPYRSKMIEICKLTKEDGIGLQKVSFPYGKLNMPAVDTYVNAKSMAANDGLYYEDWEAWFKSYDLSKPLAIIHFTKFRY